MQETSFHQSSIIVCLVRNVETSVHKDQAQMIKSTVKSLAALLQVLYLKVEIQSGSRTVILPQRALLWNNKEEF